MVNEDSESRLDEAEKNLYRRDVVPTPPPRTELRQQNFKAQADWSTREGDYSLSSNSNSFLAKVLLLAVVIFIITLGVAGFVLYRGNNQISGGNIDFEVKGPVAVKAGDETALQIVVGNRNVSNLESVKLIVEYPADTKSASSTRVALNRETADLGTIDSGEVVNKTVRASFFGDEGAEKEIKAKIEYKVAGSNALYTKETNVFLLINAPSLNLTLKGIPETVSGQKIKLEIAVLARAKQTEDKTLLVVDYPSGFVFDTASIKPSYRTNAWLLGDLVPGEEKVITIEGVLAGNEGENKSFVATVGAQDPIGEDSIAFAYNRAVYEVKIKAPFVSLGLNVDGDKKTPHIADGGRDIEVVIDWQNNLDVTLTDATIKIELSGNALNEAGIVPGVGLFRNVDKSIVWTKSSLPALASVKAGGTGSLSFRIASKYLGAADTASLRNPNIILKATMAGNRSGGGVQGEVTKAEKAVEIKLRTIAKISQRVLRAEGPFPNTGPIPPKVDQESSYTVVWRVDNSSSVLRDGVVKTILPAHIEWKNIYKPSTEELAFNPVSRELVWKLGRVLPGTTPREVSFQVGLVPTLDQVGDAPVVIGEASFSAFDTFAETVIESESPDINTKNISDSGYSAPSGIVVR